MKKPKSEVLRLEREADGSILCRSKSGEAITLPPAAAPAMERYIAADVEMAWVFGHFFAPAGSVKKTRLRIVGPVKLESMQW